MTIVCTPEETEAYAERMHSLLGLPSIPERERDLAPVGLCPKRRECHVLTPWTDPQRRVRLAWGGLKTITDGGARAFYAHLDGKPYPYAGKKRATLPPPSPAIAELAASGVVREVSPDETGQSARDREDAAPGTKWLRDNAPSPLSVVENALRGAGLDPSAVLAHFAVKGRGKLRASALVAIAAVCPEHTPVVAVADLLGMHRVKLSGALSAARSAA